MLSEDEDAWEEIEHLFRDIDEDMHDPAGDANRNRNKSALIRDARYFLYKERVVILDKNEQIATQR